MEENLDLYQHIPYEVLLDILGNLDAVELVRICQTSKYGNELCSDDYIWKTLYVNTYKTEHKILPDQLWFNNYVRLLDIFNILKLYRKSSHLTELKFLNRKNVPELGNILVILRQFKLFRSKKSDGLLANVLIGDDDKLSVSVLTNGGNEKVTLLPNVSLALNDYGYYEGDGEIVERDITSNVHNKIFVINKNDVEFLMDHNMLV
ncbi:F-box domain-containing protein [Orpheovirus IHUMI-LCC2]|uniref:F-box domain-containing protein n=1 Tax=Orpheovirus IHUMI-LCC2 TaxID=2023057 RepID=A0A2I2L539_9VIRU|nr:F-box domain-containing protein [Orpheovirus IHUMI-LCC2]SNW62636.1 F-box domain-containing protein [Orpheovirus IHUMI-LCC2]